MKIGVIIPTYNEAENLPKLIPALFALPLDLHLLVVDDNSPDGTGQLADEFSLKHPGQMNVLHRPEKSGYASASIQGFNYFLDQGVDGIGQMDADFSHDPADLVAMSEHLKDCGMVIGSRYIKGGSVDRQWSYARRGLSAFGNSYARLILGLPYHDLTTGFRLWRSDALAKIPLDLIHSRGYVFLIELTYLVHHLGIQVVEVPIYFADRKRGKTKMSFQIQIEAAWRVWQLPFIHRDKNI
ncbi:MAG: polyprenol monophosphomannose synthase [Chloroflexota bacterium]